MSFNISGSFVDNSTPMSGNVDATLNLGIQGPPGPQGASGGYYVPAIEQTGENELEISFSPSLPDMPAVDPVQVELPHSGGNADQSGVYYVATDYGISTDVEDNTPALQTLVDTVSEKGGGIIFFPVGTYNFKKAATKYAVLLKPNVSIMGENIETTVFKQTEVAPYSLFYCMASAIEPLTGCCFSNFTVDAYATGNSNAVYGKAFYIQYLRDCVFRDIRLLGTIATAMGIDYLDRVAIDNVNCVDCGRTYTGSQTGTSGIGIGTGGWEEENFTISNCICVGSGQFGIFIENQHVLGWGGNVDYSKGCIIANCVVRNGLNHGIGVRGGENVTIIGCETYENAKHGIYLDNKCKNVKILNCSSTANRLSGVYLNPNFASGRIVIRGCTLVENTEKGIYVAAVSDKLCIADNLTDENAVGLYIGALTLNDCVVTGNAFLDDVDISASFTGNADYNELASSTAAPDAIIAEAVSLGIGESAKISYAVSPTGSNADVSFESSNDEIATVSTDGTVTGISEGSCQITITSILDSAVFTTIECTVEDVVPTAITASDVSVNVGYTKTLTFDVAPPNANRSVSFESSNDGIATVDDGGKVTGVAEGNCVITIKSALDANVYTTVNCSVSEAIVPRITVPVSTLTTGYSLDTSGAETAKSGAGVSDYIDISDKFTSSDVMFVGKNFVPGSGAILCEYDSNKTLMKRTSLYVQHITDVQSVYSQSHMLNADTKYIRIAVNAITGVNSEATMIVTEEYSTFTTSNLIADSKLLSDGTTTTDSGKYLSEIVSVPDGAEYMCAFGYSNTGRLCTFDEKQTVIESFGNYATSPLKDVSYDMTGVKYIRFSTNNAPETIYLVWVF